MSWNIMYGPRPREKIPTTTPMYFASVAEGWPYPNSASANGAPSTSRYSEAGTPTAEDNPTPPEKSSLTSANLRSEACALIRRSSAGTTRVPANAEGHSDDCPAELKGRQPAVGRGLPPPAPQAR